MSIILKLIDTFEIKNKLKKMMNVHEYNIE